ncbi:MAG: D-alanyl-D-alanine carboxypeptidase, partial [Oscillospiraceae bacterium]
QADYVNLKPEKGYSQLWPAEISVDEVQKEIIVKDNIVAPIETGDVLGEMKLSYNGETIASIDLVATSRVDRSEAASKVEIAKAFPKSTEFKYAMFAVIMVFAAYSIGYLVYMQLKYMKK